LFGLFIGLFAQAQLNNSSNLKKKKIRATGVVKLDSLNIVPQSISIKGYDTSYYFIDPIKSILLWKKNLPTDSVEIVYRTFPFKLDAQAKRFSYDSIRNNFIAQPSIFKGNRNTSTGLFDFGNSVNYNGSFGRSLSFGNSQDAVFNSQLNLQLSGYVGDSIQIAAAITDNNIPIQPDGTTQQLNEFDKILIQFKRKNWEVNLGDIDLRQNQNYFLSFYKRLQGISYQQQISISKNASSKLLLSGAIAKGKFTRNVFNGQEGNQGPYKLVGANNEFYFIVLAGTERVFIDGELLQRGEDQDYVINYNTAEITFTPKRMITKDRRLQVEFEYADRNFLNAMFYASNEMQLGKKLKLNIAAYSNNDAKNSPINQQLDTKQKQFLANIGDSVRDAFYEVASIDSFSVSKILYAKRPSPINPLVDSIYVYSTHPDSAKYNLNFIDVGLNKGSYVPDFNGANGKVYKWIAPINGIPQGQYEPATFLVTPKKQQVVTVGAEYTINSRMVLKTDAALSNYDANTFSSKDKSDNKGYAAKFSLYRNDRLSRKRQLNSMIGYEWVDAKFRPLERLRSVEFTRDWGLPILPTAATEHLPKASIEYKDAKNNSLQYTVDGYLRSDDYKGMKQTLQHLYEVKNLQLRTYLSLVNSNTPFNKGQYFRPIVDASKLLPKLRNYTIGASYALEHNEQRNKITDTITPLSFAFETITAYLKSNQQKNNRWSFTYFTRNNKLPYQKSLLQTDRSHNYNLTAELLNNSKHQFRFNVTYRQLYVSNAFLTNLQPDNSLLGRAEYAINELNGFITGNVLYELGAGQEQRRDFSYIEVPAGRGEYAWIDYNNDGIPQLNEFEIALFTDQAKYIRVFTPTNVFVKSNYNQFNYSININPRALGNKIHNKKLKNFIERFNMQSTMQTGKKVLAQGNPEFNPFKGNISDTTLISLNNILSNTISFNRFSSSWGMDMSNVRNYSKALLTYGFESHELNEWVLRARANINRQYTIELVQKLGSSNLLTPKFSNRNYELSTNSTEPKLTYTYQTKYRLQATYLYAVKENVVIYGGEKSTNKAFNIEGKLNAVNNTSLLAKFTYSNIDYLGTTNTTVSYIMLDGLLPGKNLLWNIELTKRLGKSLEVSFNYEGRKPAESRVINIGRASLRALL
jgi:hypothetical protein